MSISNIASGPSGRSNTSHSTSFLSPIIENHRPNLPVYEKLCRNFRQAPEISRGGSVNAALVASHLERLDFEIHTSICNHSVVGVLENGPGKTVLIHAELEGSNLPYRSARPRKDCDDSKISAMHACGHDVHMTTLLASSALLRSAKHDWSGTLVVLFQTETAGARGTLDDDLFESIPIPDIMLGQHVAPFAAGEIANPVYVATDATHVRIIGGTRTGVTPTIYVDPISVASHILMRLQDFITKIIGPDELTTVACWGTHGGGPSSYQPAHADFILNIKTCKPGIRLMALVLAEEMIKEECRAAHTPQEPIITTIVRAPLANNDPSILQPMHSAFSSHFASNFLDIDITRSCNDFSLLGARHNVPYIYWNFGGSADYGGKDASNDHDPYFARTIQVGMDAMALAVLTFLAK